MVDLGDTKINFWRERIMGYGFWSFWLGDA